MAAELRFWNQLNKFNYNYLESEPSSY